MAGGSVGFFGGSAASGSAVRQAASRVPIAFMAGLRWFSLAGYDTTRALQPPTGPTMLKPLLLTALLAADAPKDLNPVRLKAAPQHAAVPLVERGQPKATICVMG